MPSKYSVLKQISRYYGTHEDISIRHTKCRVIAAIYISAIALPMAASVSSAKDTISAEIGFRRSHSQVDPSYRRNAEVIGQFIDSVSTLHTDPAAKINSIEIISFASPDGPLEFNKRIALRRGLNTASYLKKEMPFIPDSIYTVTSGNINWGDLEQMVDVSDWKYRSAVLDILLNVPEARIVNGKAVPVRINRLKRLAGGRPYYHMYHTYFTDLLNTAARVKCRYEKFQITPPDLQIADNQQFGTYNTTTTSPLEIQEPEYKPQPQPEFPPAPETAVPEWRRHIYVKTNIPAWLCLWANAAGEADIAPRWSVNLALYWSGWEYFKHDLKFRTFAVMPEVRFWFKPGNDGFFLGVHPGLAYYNIATDGEFRYQDHDGRTPALGGGVSVGFRFAVPRNPKWKFEASVGAGIYRLDYDVFRNVHNGPLVDRRRRTFYGIDNAAFSVCYTFDITRKAKKGGDRE